MTIRRNNGSTKYTNGYCGGHRNGCDGNDYEEGTEMGIERTCGNCDNCSDCFCVEDISADCDGGFAPRKDIVDLHGKLRKAVEAIELHRKINELWTTCDHDTKLYEVLEELQ
jgi:hypothetical protein